MMQGMAQHQTTELSRSAAGNLRAYLARAEISDRAAADLIGVDQSWLWRRLHGRGNITLDDVELIAAGLQIPISNILAMSAPPGGLEPPTDRFEGTNA